ncbi:MAG: TetR/AcrR family transcriptional regulator [Elusimicrobia bacterium]|nr:TetR/AcrR family transcriptional regulator [Elusimicrobiota bacterium]
MNTKEKIVAAAIEIFAEKGKYGATMDEIANKANINKAMLYYFFNTKGNIYNEALSFILTNIHKNNFANLKQKLFRTENPIEIIKLIVRNHLRALSSNMNFTKILIEAMVHNPLEITKTTQNIKNLNSQTSDEADLRKRFLELYAKGVSNGKVRDIDPDQLMISIMGMILIYFISKPISQLMLNIDVKNEKSFLKKREESIIDLILNGISLAKGGSK